MPIKIKKFDIEDHTENPEIGYMYLGFDGNGTLVQKDEDGNYQPVVKSDGSKEFDRLTVKYLTVGGTRVFGIPEGDYTISQGTANTCQGGISYVRGINSHTDGYLSFASGEYVIASGISSYVWGKGSSTSLSVISDGVNSFVHEYLIGAPSSIGTLSDYSVILGGYNHNIGSSSDNAVILGGYINKIGSNNANAVILSGNDNDIGTNTLNCVIVGGIQNFIPDYSEHIIILGRDSLTPTENNTTYVTKLCLNSSGPSIDQYPDGLIWYEDDDIKAMINGTKESLKAPSAANFVTVVGAQSITGHKTFNSAVTFTSYTNFNSMSTFNDNLYLNDSSISYSTDFYVWQSGGYGGSVQLAGGTGSNGGGTGGNICLSPGTGGYNSSNGQQGTGGNLILNGGAGGTSFAGGYGGNVNINGGRSYGNYSGGNVSINGGISNTGIGGNIFLLPGTSSNTIKGSICVGTISPDYNYVLNINGKTITSDIIYCSKYTDAAQFSGDWPVSNRWGIGCSSSNILKIQSCDVSGVWAGGSVQLDITGNITTSNTILCNKKTNTAQFVGDRQTGGYWGIGSNGYDDSLTLQGCNSVGNWNGNSVKLNLTGRLKSNVFMGRSQHQYGKWWSGTLTIDNPDISLYFVGMSAEHNIYLPDLNQIVNGEYCNDGRIIYIITTNYGAHVYPYSGQRLNSTVNGNWGVENQGGQMFFGRRDADTPGNSSWYRLIHY